LRAQDIVADPSPQLFTVLAAINLAGYDAGMEKPELVPLRAAIREELAQRTISILPDLQEFYRSHQQGSPDQDLSQYVSLALFLSPPPEFQLPQNPANVPLEVWDLRDMAPLLAAFYREADLANLWEKHSPAMEQEADRYRKILTQVIQETTAYLRMDASGSGNRRFAIYISPLGAPDQTNARSYGDNYYLVFGPSVESPEEDIRHGWLHYLLDPYPYRNARLVESKSDLHRIAARAPALDPALRSNFGLLLTESLIRAIQARRVKGDPETRRRAAQEAVAEGFYLTTYFFDAMEKFADQPVGMSLYYSEMVEAISVRDEQRRLASVQFRTSPSRLRAEAQWNSLEQLTQMGETSLARGDYEEARQTLETVSRQYGPQPRVLYGLAIVASQQKQPERAKEYFAAAASLATDPRTKAWSHIYLGRLLDLEGNRPAAQAEYQAALAAGDSAADTREAAEKGLKTAFAAPGGSASAPGTEPPENKPRQRVPLGRTP
jgi:tetratricopeptide (TPR) repeat protein